MTHKIHHGNNIDILKTYPDNHFDSIVTDPPYGIEFLGKDWDSNTGAVETWQECFRVLKPGGYLLAFSAARTYHNLATNIEGVGFEIRDQLMWLYASGFPKAQDIGKSIQRRLGVEETKEFKHNNPRVGGDGDGTAWEKNNKTGEIVVTDPEARQWEGWKTALKPSHEPIVMARKPFKGSCIDNVLTHGVGALNIDATRVPFQDEKDIKTYKNNIAGPLERSTATEGDNIKMFAGETGFKAQKGSADDHMVNARFPSNVLGEVEGYQKYFYCPKVSRAERHCGFEAPPDPLANYSQGDVKNHPLWDPSIGTNLQRLKHKILEHNKDMGKKVDPLAHLDLPDFSRKKDENGKPVKDNSSWMYDPKGVEKIQKATKKVDPLAHIPAPFGDVKGCYVDGERFAVKHQEYQQTTNVGNNHPTVKPVALMRYLIKLVTPGGGSVLDPFTGSGSTGMAAVELGHHFTGCELDQHYVDIANTRITAWKAKTDLTGNKLPEEFFEE